MRYLVFLLLLTPLCGEDAGWTYLVHSRKGELHYNKESKLGVLKLSDLNKLAGVFTSQSQREVGMAPLSTIVDKWEGTPYGMVTFTTQDGFRSVPLTLTSARFLNGDLEFQIKVLSDRGLKTSVETGETLLYIDEAKVKSSCLFPGDGTIPACYQ